MACAKRARSPSCVVIKFPDTEWEEVLSLFLLHKHLTTNLTHNNYIWVYISWERESQKLILKSATVHQVFCLFCHLLAQQKAIWARDRLYFSLLSDSLISYLSGLHQAFSTSKRNEVYGKGASKWWVGGVCFLEAASIDRQRLQTQREYQCSRSPWALMHMPSRETRRINICSPQCCHFSQLSAIGTSAFWGCMSDFILISSSIIDQPLDSCWDSGQ